MSIARQEMIAELHEKQERENRIVELEDESARLTEAIRSVVTQKADDICWMDAYVMLGKLVGIEVTAESLAMLPTAKMLGNCERFIDSLKGGCPYEKDFATERIRELETKIADIEEENKELLIAMRAIYRAEKCRIADLEKIIAKYDNQ